jgi:hypothetical protein
MATIALPVEVRSGPSEKYYVTGKLLPGDKVEVVNDKQVPWLATRPPNPGWLAIKPPPGSLSWINKRFLTLNGQYGVVNGQADVPIRIGSAIYDGRPDVEQVKLKPGSPVVVVGKEQTDADGVWVPITPGPQEVRYIPADAIKAVAPVQTVSSPPPPLASPGAEPAAAQSPVTPPTYSAKPENPIWLQAEKAEKDGKLAEAENLYKQLAEEVKGNDHDLWIRCHNRIHFINEERKKAVAPAGHQSYPYATAQAPAANALPGRATSQYTYVREPAVPPPAPASVTANAAYATAIPERWTGPGRLMRTAFTIEGKQAFRLELGGQYVYVTAQPGINLESYVEKNVRVYGAMVYRTGERVTHMTATQVIPQ